MDAAFAGCYFAIVDAESLGYEIKPREARQLVDLGTRIRPAANKQISVNHSLLPDFESIEYALFSRNDGTHIRNGNVIFPGRMDRSPCGTGTAAKLAIMHARGELKVGERLEARSIIDSVFTAEISATAQVGPRSAVIPRISGRAWIFGHYTLGSDPSDPFREGYTLPDIWGEGLS